jgi:hypothetical protein
VDADTGEEVSSKDIVKGYKVDTDSYIEITKEELDNIALDSNRTIDIVPKAGIDPRYLIRPLEPLLYPRLATDRSLTSAASIDTQASTINTHAARPVYQKRASIMNATPL